MEGNPWAGSDFLHPLVISQPVHVVGQAGELVGVGGGQHAVAEVEDVARGTTAGLDEVCLLYTSDAAVVLPGDRERRRRVAALDGAAGVALELVAPAEPQVAADGQEPVGQSF